MADERKSSLIVLQADMTIEEIEVLIEEIQRVSEYMGIKLTFKQEQTNISEWNGPYEF